MRKNHDNFIMLPTVDFCFKELMKNDRVRKGFVAALLGIDPEEVKETRLMPTFMSGEFPDDKLGVLDVRTVLADGSQMDLEMQVAYFAYWERRILFYLGRMYTGQLQKGDTYGKLKKCIHVSILDFVHFPEDQECYRTIHLRDDRTGEMYTDLFEIQILELAKLPADVQDGEAVVSWMRFFSGKSREEFEYMAENNEYMNEAYQTLLNLSADERKRLEYEAREKAIWDYNSQMESAREMGMSLGLAEGLSEGLSKGLSQGRLQGKLETLTELVQDGLISLEEAAKRLEMTEEELKGKLKDLETSE